MCGGATYFSRIVRASTRRRVSIARAGSLDAGRVGALLRLEQALVVLARELAVDRQPERRAVVAPARQLDRELDARVRCPAPSRRWCAYCVGVNTCSSRPAELHLAEHAARLDVAQHAAERADVARPASASRRGRGAPARAARRPGGSSRRGAARASRAASRRRSRASARASSRCRPGSRRAAPRPSPRTSAIRWSLARTSACSWLAERLGELASATPPGAGLARRASHRATRAPGAPARPAPSVAWTSDSAEMLLRRRELAAEAVDLLVLRARRLALLREQRAAGRRRASRRAPGASPGRCASTSSRSSRACRSTLESTGGRRSAIQKVMTTRSARSAGTSQSKCIARLSQRRRCAGRAALATSTRSAPRLVSAGDRGATSARRDRTRLARSARAPPPATRRRA